MPIWESSFKTYLYTLAMLLLLDLHLNPNILDLIHITWRTIIISTKRETSSKTERRIFIIIINAGFRVWVPSFSDGCFSVDGTVVCDGTSVTAADVVWVDESGSCLVTMVVCSGTVTSTILVCVESDFNISSALIMPKSYPGVNSKGIQP